MPVDGRRRTSAHAGALLLLLVFASALGAQQTPRNVGGLGEVFAGSELERYLRVLQLAGVARPYPWTVRAFGDADLDRILPVDTAAHPWRGRYTLGAAAGEHWFSWVAPHATTVLNTGFPYGSNDGAIWAGRGATAALQAGFALRYGPLSLTVAPLAFIASNAGFELISNGETGDSAYADWRARHRSIDLPQRFGDGTYARLDPGQSTLRVDLAGLAAGISTANEIWGPAIEQPIILGNNAPGFLHGFAGTSTPLSIGVGKLHARALWGRLEQSEYSFARKGEQVRFASGLVASFSPRGIPGLEIGGARFFHLRWPAGGFGVDEFFKPFGGLFKDRQVEKDPDPNRPGESLAPPDNQIASLFARWVFPKSGFEVYGEYGKEDHNYDQRDLVLNFDHNAGYLVGFQKLWKPKPNSWTVLRAEVLNLQVSHVGRARSQAPFYVHSYFRQGHTHRGQILGAPAGYGGAGSVLALDRYTTRGRWTLAWRRELRGDEGDFWKSGAPEQRGLDVQHALGGDWLGFYGRWDVQAGAALVYERNRGFGGGSAFNLNATLGARFGL